MTYSLIGSILTISIPMVASLILGMALFYGVLRLAMGQHVAKVTLKEFAPWLMIGFGAVSAIAVVLGYSSLMQLVLKGTVVSVSGETLFLRLIAPVALLVVGFERALALRSSYQAGQSLLKLGSPIKGLPLISVVYGLFMLESAHALMGPAFWQLAVSSLMAIIGLVFIIEAPFWFRSELREQGIYMGGYPVAKWDDVRAYRWHTDERSLVTFLTERRFPLYQQRFSLKVPEAKAYEAQKVMARHMPQVSPVGAQSFVAAFPAMEQFSI